MSDQPGAFGVYIHIPYCLQRCTYCDFATYVHTEILPADKYVELVKKEIALRKHFFPPQQLSTLYFGGGTPSLVDSQLIVNLIQELAKHGFTTGPETEITLEINPATVDQRKLEHYLSAGVNRFSVGAQTFHDRLLKMVHREHNATQTFETLQLLKSYDLNFSFDVLFALPTQTKEELLHDVQVAVELGSKHISPYCLTVPEGHPLSKNRPLEDEQVEMFEIIHRELTQKSFRRYEISNYAQPGYDSKHNMLYWTDQPYWGLGLSAHSYAPKLSGQNWGHRFWNHNNIDLYEKEIVSGLMQKNPAHEEFLDKHQALTDFCHTSLRISDGLSRAAVLQKFGPEVLRRVEKTAEKLLQHKMLVKKDDSWTLTDAGVLVSNQIFENFTYLASDLA